ncbi:BTAD domain-containing putative transcriptional regulator [Radiobacillus sp. PE A8.2]|uniref:BTAD domain-containing putative transcriptional regulator n=1 Tax=Radiobacillus sp. PE A8.2 TaxID=3380349 RepID=UPI00388F816A
MEQIPVIQSQIIPPSVKELHLRRASLHKKLAAISRYPLTIVHAGAGYGKTTALTLFVHDICPTACWYTVSPNDDTLAQFLTKIVYAIRRECPTFGKGLLSELSPMPNKEKRSVLVSLFINDLIKQEQDIMLVLDEFHHIQSADIDSWLTHVLEYIPENFRLILSCRTKPKWSLLTSFKVKGELNIIGQESLVLSKDDMEHLLVDMMEFPIETDQLEALYRLTEGWPIAFGMLADHMYQGSEVATILENRHDNLQELYDFVKLEIFSKQSVDVQQFLLQTSIVDRLSPMICNALLGMDDAEAKLDDLFNQNMFIEKLADNYYRYHTLFHEFLVEQLRSSDLARFYSLHGRAAKLYEQQDVEKAVYHYAKLNQYEPVARIISDYGSSMLKSGKLQALSKYVSLLPATLKDQYTILWFYEGEVNRFRSAYDEAEHCYNRAIRIGEQKDDTYLTSLALEGVARIYLDTIQPDRAEWVLQRAIHLKENTNTSKQEEAGLYQLLAENLLNNGQAGRAEKWYKRAEALHLPVEDGNLQARIYLRTGRLEKSRDVLLRRKNSQTHDNTKHLAEAHRETDILLALIEVIRGNAEESKAYAQTGINLGMNMESPFVEACGWMRMGHAVQLIDRYESILAEKCYHTALSIMEKIHVSRGKAEPYMGLCLLYGANRQYEKAIEAGQKGLYETEKVKDLWLSSLIQLCMAIASIYNEKYDLAIETLLQVKKQLEQCGDRYSRMVTAFWLAYVAYETDDESTFEKEMRDCIKEIQAGNYEFFLKQRTIFGPQDLQNFAPMLLKAQNINIHRPFVTKIISELELENVENHPGYTLKIQTLGRLRLWLGNQIIEEGNWQREKAKELFEFFITNRNKMILKEEIYQELWPDQDVTAANQSFKVALNALLKTLEPNRKARSESFFIRRSGSLYGINDSSAYQLDTITFEEWIMEGLQEQEPSQAKELLERGLLLYKGNYLPNRRFDNWCINERERLHVIYLRAAEKMAQVSVRLYEFDNCIHWCHKILREDDTWEEAYRLLMYSYYQKNNRPQSIKWYRKCKEVLNKELGVKPMGPTNDMYHMIVDSDDDYNRFKA